MGKIEVKGLEEVSSMLEALSADAEAIIKMGIYDGAGVIARAVAESIDALPMDSGPITSSHPIMRGPTEAQKAGLKESFGISKMRQEGDLINVSIGFDGYNSVKTRKYPQGQPNQLIARSIESGTSYMQKTPFVRRALNKVKKQAIDAMQKRVSSVVRQIAERNE